MSKPLTKIIKLDKCYHQPIISYKPVGTHSSNFSIELPYPISERICDVVLDIFEKKAIEFFYEITEERF